MEILLALSFFCIALSFALSPKSGVSMSIVNIFGFVFLGIGGLILLFSLYLGVKWIQMGSLYGTQEDYVTKIDLDKFKENIIKEIKNVNDNKDVGEINKQIREELQRIRTNNDR